jgi:ATP-binding cassette subfamily C protein LapB
MKLPGVQVAVLRWMRFDHHKLPVLIWHQQQWWLLKADENGKLSLLDNKGKAHSCNYDDFASDAAVIYFRVRESRKNPSLLAKHSASRLVLTQMFKRRRWLFDVLVATVLINVLAISTSIFAMQVYDRVVPTLAYATLWTLAAGMGGVLFIDWILKSLRARILDSASCEVNNEISQSVFDHLMQVRLDQRPRSLGTMAAQVGGLDSVRQFFSAGVVFGLVDFPFALMFIALISIIGGPIAYVYLGLLPIALLIGYLCQKRLKRLTKEQMQRVNERQGALVDAIQGSESIKTLNASWRFSDQWRDITQTIGHYNI